MTHDCGTIYCGIINSRRELAKSSLIADRFACGMLIVHTENASIYQGWDTVSGDAVTLKKLHESASSERIGEFCREGVLLKLVQHPGLLQGQGYFLWKDQHWLVMEPAAGSLLLDLIGSGKAADWDNRMKRKVISNIARALDWLHKDGWEHGDIKPDNIFVEPTTGDTQLIDYSSTRMLGSSRSDQSFSPEWQHPDFAESSVDTQADSYGLALLAWCLWTNQHPFAESGKVNFNRPPMSWPWRAGCWRNGLWLRGCLENPTHLTLAELEYRFGFGLLNFQKP